MTEQHSANPYGGIEPPRFDDPAAPGGTTGTGVPATGVPATGVRASSPSTPAYTAGNDLSGTYATPGAASRSGESGNGAAGTAKQEARRVADTAASAGGDVAHTAKDQANQVAAEAKQQAASLLDTVRTEVGTQAGSQQQRIAEAVHSLSKELGSMASSSSESGPLTDLAQQASQRGGEIAHWLQDREPADVLEAVRSYARRRPVTFLALCGLAGVLAGRLTRSTVATRTSLDSHDDDDDRPRSVTDGGTGYGYQRYAAIEPGTPARSTGTLASETSTAVAPTAYRDPFVPEGGDPTR